MSVQKIYLVSWTALSKCIELIHFRYVFPKMMHISRNFKVQEELSGYPNMLKLGHKLTIKAAKSVSWNQIEMDFFLAKY